MSSANKATLVYALYRTSLNASATAGAKRVIDSCEVILNGDSAVGTGLLTFHTANTAVGAVLTYESALILVGAFNNYARGVVHKVNDAVGTFSYANSTADTLLGVDSCYAVFDSDSILRANSRAVAVAKTSKGAEFVAAVRHIGGTAGLVTLVVILSRGNVACAVAGNERYLFNNVLSLNTENSGNVLSSLVAAGNTKIGLIGSLVCKSLCVSVTARVAAGAAVGAGQTVTDSYGGRVLFYTEENGGAGEDHTADKRYSKKNKYRN